MSGVGGFREAFAETDGFHLRYCEAGEGPPLLHLHGAGGLRLTPAHDLLAQRFRVIAAEMPGFGSSAENTRTQSQAELAATMARLADALRLDRFNLWGTSFGGRTALWLMALAPERVEAVVLEAPAAIRPAGMRTPSGDAEAMARLLYAHPERMPPFELPGMAVRMQTAALVLRLRGPDRDAALETRLRDVDNPVLAVFGTRDVLMPPELGRHYKELLPNGHLAFVYDAGHAIASERPEAFSDIAADFLARHEAFVITRTESVLHP